MPSIGHGSNLKMDKEEIYEHLAQVYLGKKAQDKPYIKKKFSVAKHAKVILTLIAVCMIFYSLTAFLSRRHDFKASIIFALNNSPIRVKYDLNDPFPQVKDFSIAIPPTADIARYKNLNFSIRGLEEGYPDVVRIVLKNKKNETAFQYIKDVNLKWQQASIRLEDFSGISDWSTLSEVSFVLEGWNVKKKKGIILIDDICFSK